MKNNKFVVALFLTILLSLTFKFSTAQYDPLHKPNTYRSKDNPYYWKNRKPYPSYWQQDTHYEIDATINDQENTITGSEKLTYWNNSPDTLTRVYFHLYQNAFQPGSYHDKLEHLNKNKPKYGKYEQQGLGTAINKFNVNGKPLKFEIDNTILFADLSQPLLPGQSITFDIDFITYYDMGSVRRRMKMFIHDGVKHYDGVHWYPRISVYDRKFGWTTDQHLGKEFYGDFGTYDVSLTFPEQYVVEATGNLTNRKEALPESLRKQLDISNYDKRMHIKIPYDSTKTKTWIYHAENTHDFAFTADPSYRIGEAEWNGIKCIALVQENKAHLWHSMPDYITRIIKTYSEDFGMYAYPKMVVADARDGMEYPMLTLCGGIPPSNHSLIVHEVGHNWFYGMIGNNETYRAPLDEGFTQFLTGWALDHLDGKNFSTREAHNFYEKWFIDSITNLSRNVYYPYIIDALQDKDPQLNTHSDDFNNALDHGGGYRQVYYKTATMLNNLQYVLGDELFSKAMKHYFNKWKIAHPYFKDFRKAIIEYTHVDLNWFFDEWLETTKSIDYKVANVKRTGADGAYAITFKRNGDMQMPIDFRVILKDGSYRDFYIPNTYFIKKTDAEVLPKWTGWGRLSRKYVAYIKVPGKIKNVIIDPTDRLADIYHVDNSKKCNTKLEFDSKVWNYPDWKNYNLYWRPDIWYNEVDGFKAGLHLEGNYLNYEGQFHLTAWYNTGLINQLSDDEESIVEDDLLPLNFNLTVRNPLRRIDPELYVIFKGKILDGLYQGYLGAEKQLNSQNTLTIGVSSAIRPESADLVYLLYPNEWIADKWNNALQIDYEHTYRYYEGNGDIKASVYNSAFASDYDFTRLQLEVINHTKAGKLNFRTRVFSEYTLGDNIAPESQLYLAGARPMEMMDNKYVRSRAFVPEDWQGYNTEINHFHHGGGLNLRGYSGYLAPVKTDSGIAFTYKGTAGAAANVEMDFERLVNFHPGKISEYLHLNTYLFGDAGIINTNALKESLKLADVRMDAGVGIALTIKKFAFLETVAPLTIRFDMPLYLSHAPYEQPDNFDFRWVVGVNRAF